jgi:anaerobic dimethyl sulfoxide reductase subunit C (anchor subunit)
VQTDDWTLVLFTVAVQAVVGAVVTAVVVQWRLGRAGEQEVAERLLNRSLPWLGGLMAVAVTVSLVHLGHPLRAIYAINNLAGSWLSREVLLVGLVAGSGALLGVLQWRSWGSATVRRMLGWLTAALGVALLVAMSGVYMLATVPPWNRLATPLAFAGTAALLGVVTVAALLAGLGPTDSGSVVRRLQSRLLVVLLALIGLRLVVIVATALPVTGVPVAGGQPPAAGPGPWAPIVQAALLVIAAAVLAARRRDGIPATRWLSTALLVGGSELIGRALFFASYWRTGV